MHSPVLAHFVRYFSASLWKHTDHNHSTNNRYWAIGLHPGATAFFRFTLYLFLGVMAAESQSVLVAAIIPIFVAALAVAAFMNGFWMVRHNFHAV